MSLDGAKGVIKQKQVWFGAINFEDTTYTKPDLVVVVFFRLGKNGREATSYAVKMIEKWKSLKDK